VQTRPRIYNLSLIHSFSVILTATNKPKKTRSKADLKKLKTVAENFHIVPQKNQQLINKHSNNPDARCSSFYKGFSKLYNSFHRHCCFCFFLFI